MADAEISSYHFMKWDLGGTYDTPGEVAAHAYLLALSGIAAGNWYGNDSGWNQYTVRFDVPFPDQFWMFLRYWTPSVALASIGHDGPQDSGGWAVDGFRLVPPAAGQSASAATLECDLAARNPTGVVWRVAFNVQMIGYRL